LAIKKRAKIILMTDCVFCKIVAGELPCYKVYENGNFLGFLDIHPLTLGNSLLIPKDHHRWVFDVPNFGEYFDIAKKISLVSQTTLKAESVSLLTLGYDVPHAHIRIIPRYPNDLHPHGIDTHIDVATPQEEMHRISSEIFAIFNP
jgi:histidine triad (HIT) family protein